MDTCTICWRARGRLLTGAGFVGFDCDRCGAWIAAGGFETVGYLQTKLGPWDDPLSVHRRSRLSHIVRSQQRTDGRAVEIPLQHIESWRLEDDLPTPLEQLDRLVLLVGEYQPGPSESANLKTPFVASSIGTLITLGSESSLGWLLQQPTVNELVHTEEPVSTLVLLRLTMPGWARYWELRRGRVESRTVLMAMKFGDVELDQVVANCFRPAVKRAGFDLRALNERQAAGLIDDQMRVALRTSRFILADLTHNSSGAYWEAGFAEGLGRPVIYTCREAEWSQRRSHFDTNHLVTIVWRSDALADAGARLTDTIRATLPSEAVMTD